MIAKHVAMKSVRKSDFGELVKYMTDEQGKNERVGYVSITNCQSDRLDAAVLEVLNTQDRNIRAESDKTFHLVVSFPPNEQPSDVVLKEIEAKLCDGLGYAEHQRISVVHHDTDNLHLHIAINKIHPTRYTILDPYYSHKVLGNLCEKIEQEYGLTPVNHVAKRTISQNHAADMERHSDVESLMSWIKRDCLEPLKSATSWAEVHKVMNEYSLELRERGNGFVFVSHDGLMVKASSVAREFSKNRLEERLGVFIPSETRLSESVGQKRYESKPLPSKIDTTLLFAQYKVDQQNINGHRSQEFKVATANKERLIEAAKRSNNLRRASIKLMGKSRDEKKLLYSLSSKSFCDEINNIRKKYQAERKAISVKYAQQTWADWLRSKASDGDNDALAALRAREIVNGLKGNTIEVGGGYRQKTNVNASQDSVTKKGTIIYRVGSSAVKDDGNKLKVSREADSDGLMAALRIAMERYGSRITVNGTDDFKSKIVQAAVAANFQITFADSALERQRQSLSTLNTENKYEEPTKHSSNERRRGTGGGISNTGSAVRGGDGTSSFRSSGFGGGTGAGKPNIGRAGKAPPPESRNRLRNLSDVAVVRDASGSKVLLPGDVLNHLEQQGTKPDSTLRRPVSWERLDAKHLPAANHYIQEREEKRALNIDIPKHRLYNNGDVGGSFAGIRRIDDFPMALLRRDDEIVVMPISEAVASRLKRLSIGDSVAISKDGAIKKTRGRSR